MCDAFHCFPKVSKITPDNFDKLKECFKRITVIY
ncbi:hypothetical protein EcWSU1_03931 [Enterobacter ludwigii]|uniref:Uncharacterized protein n=1 Tax=Enterobacter ludwigii TaxID=299767 RepID=G8LFJ1_9ENTR|nr:hypothetical protein EcWSU1_03931 [Enterobacter ludwigii]